MVASEILQVRGYLEDVGMAAAAGPTSLWWVGELPAHKVERACIVVCKVRGAVHLLDEVWGQLLQPGLVNVLRRCLMRRLVVRQLRQIREELDAVRIGEHPRWSVQPGGAS